MMKSDFSRRRKIVGFAMLLMAVLLMFPPSARLSAMLPQVGIDARPKPAPRKSTPPKKSSVPPKKSTGSSRPSRSNSPSPSRSTNPKPEPVTALALATRAKDYLVNTRGIDAERIMTVDGGYLEEPTVELWIVPAGATPPLPRRGNLSNHSATMFAQAGQLSGEVTIRQTNGTTASIAGASNEVARPVQQSCPRIEVSCPTTISEGQPVMFTADVRGGNQNVTPTYSWSVSAGTISSGQGTPVIAVDTVATGGQAITATVEVGGLPASCMRTASCSLMVASISVARKFDGFGQLNSEDEKARLDNFAIQLQNDPSAKGYIIAYAGRRR